MGRTGEASQAGPLLSRKHWRRALAAWVEGRLTGAEFERMKERLARVRGATLPASSPPPPDPPRLRIVRSLPARPLPQPRRPDGLAAA
jgi:hypothetical protein